MFLDTTFLIDLAEEVETRTPGPTRAWLARHRRQPVWITVISAGELAAGMRDNNAARIFLASYRVVRLHPEIAYEAATIDRELSRSGRRLGENDNWIAGFARYYGMPLVSNDHGFDRVTGIRRLSY